MRSNGLATILLLIPVLTVPALAIFGVPQFAPVVASPLDEGRETDRESRVGNSARKSQDEFFGDVEGFGDEPDSKDDLPLKRRSSSTTSGTNRRDGTRRPKESITPGWGDDLADDSEWRGKQRRRMPMPSDAPEVDDSFAPSTPSSGMGNPPRSLNSERLARENRRQKSTVRNDEELRLASTADIGSGVVQAGFDDDNGPEKPRNSNSANGARPEDSRGAKRQKSGSAPLSWQAAVQRLNELDIRNFRLEPGHQLGQFVFICSYSPPDSPRVSYRFEAGADEPLQAVEKVLEQIVEWQQRR